MVSGHAAKKRQLPIYIEIRWLPGMGNGGWWAFRNSPWRRGSPLILQFGEGRDWHRERLAKSLCVDWRGGAEAAAVGAELAEVMCWYPGRDACGVGHRG